MSDPMRAPADSYYECADFFDGGYFDHPTPDSGVLFTVRGLDRRNTYWHVGMADADAFRRFLLDNPHVAEMGAVAYPEIPDGVLDRLRQSGHPSTRQQDDGP